MELDFRKKSRRDRMMYSKNFEMQEVREIGHKEAGESRGFPILWMEIIKVVFSMEGKECKDQERLKMCLKKLMSGRGRYFGMGWETLGQWQWTKPGLCTHEKFSGKKEKQKDERDSSGTWSSER